jgi:hypothetical protein
VPRDYVPMNRNMEGVVCSTRHGEEFLGEERRSADGHLLFFVRMEREKREAKEAGVGTWRLGRMSASAGKACDELQYIRMSANTNK